MNRAPTQVRPAANGGRDVIASLPIKSRPNGRLCYVVTRSRPYLRAVATLCVASRSERAAEAEGAGDVMRLAETGGEDREVEQGVGGELMIHVEADTRLIPGRG
ncbi:MAG: hypothetical protein RL639_1408 [Verrucomicrobiota bacterium]